MAKSNLLTGTILSMSLLTVMAGAAVAPALGAVKAHFSNADPLLIQFVVSLPALFIILTNFLFPMLCRRWTTRTIALAGLVLYTVAGAGAFFATGITCLLILRALLGVSVGMLMPLSTGLLAYYYPPEKIAGLMGLSAAMNQMGGVVATLLAGLLSTIAWNYAFLVYLLGIAALALVLLFLPADRLPGRAPDKQQTGNKARLILRFHPSVGGMLLLMCTFFVYPTNFALTGSHTGLSAQAVTYIMVGLDAVAFFTGLLFGQLMRHCRRSVKYLAPIGFLAGYLCLARLHSLSGILLGSVAIGLANGIGVPYLNTIASIKGGQESATTVLPLLSAALYAGQFVSPLIVVPLAQHCFPEDIFGAYYIGMLLAVIFLLQVFCTRRFQALPPQENA